MANSGWIKFYRQTLDSNVFDNPMLLKVWIWCLCKTTGKAYSQVVGTQIIRLAPGEFITGRKQAARELNMSESTVYKYWKMLVDLGMISIKCNNKFSLINVVNWRVYQSKDSQSVTTNHTATHTTEHTATRTATHTQTRIKEYKEDKEYIKPSADEINSNENDCYSDEEWQEMIRKQKEKLRRQDGTI